MRYKLILLVLFCFLGSKALILQAQVINPAPATGTILGCKGSASVNPNLQKIAVAATGLSSNITATAPANFQIAIGATGTYGNTATLPQTGGLVYVRTTATAPAGNLSGNVTFSSPGANTPYIQVNAVIKDLPVINTVSNQVLNSGELTTPVNFIGNGPKYSWANNNVNIGIGAKGSGSIPAFSATNKGTTPIIATFTVTPMPAGYIYTANYYGKSVSVINTGNNTRETDIPVGDQPINTLVSPDQSKVYAICTDGIYVIDAFNNSVSKKINIPGNYGFLMLSYDKSQLYAFINNGGLPSTFMVIDIATDGVIGTLSLGPISTYAINSKDGKHVYVNTYGIASAGPTYAIDVATLQIDKTWLSNSYAQGIALSPDGNKLYISDHSYNYVAVINLLTNAITKIPTGTDPEYPTLSPDGSRMYISNMISDDVTVINTATDVVVTTISVGQYPKGTAITPDGKFLYVSNRASKTISVINTGTNKVVKTIPLPGSIALDKPVMSPDGTTLYVSDLFDNFHIISTATNTLVTSIPSLEAISYSEASISQGIGCAGTPVTFTITVNQAVKSISQTGNLNAVNTTYGIPSPSTSFMVSGTNLSTGITVTPPLGFEVSADNVNFSNTLIVSSATTANPKIVYIRLAKLTNAGLYNGDIVLSSSGAVSVNVPMPNSMVVPSILNITGSYSKLYGDALTNFTLFYNTPNTTFDLPGLRNGNTFKSIIFTFGAGAPGNAPVGVYTNSVTLSDFEGDNGFLASNYTINYYPFDLIILPAPLIVVANNVNKPFGTSLTYNPAATEFTAVGLQNNDKIDRVGLSYGAGAGASDAPGLYTGSVVPSGATGVNFSPANYDITYMPGNLNIDTPPLPVISYTGMPAALATTYGQASTVTSINVSGTNLTSAITATAPTGFEISTDNSIFSSSVVLLPDAAGVLNATKIYMRLAAITPAGSYNNPLVLHSTGVGNTNILLQGIVNPAMLIITANQVTKAYGIQLINVPASINFITSGLQNNQTVNHVTISYGPGALAADAPGFYPGSVIPSGAAGGTFSPGNYAITYKAGDITIDAPPLPVISYTGVLTTLQTSYGTSSPFVSIDLSGTNITSGITVTAPPGFEIGTDNGNFSSTTNIASGANGVIVQTKIYIRLKATTPAGNYADKLVLFTPGTGSINIPLTGTVTPAPLIVIANPAIKTYGTALTTNPGSILFTTFGLKNGETAGFVTLTYNDGSAADAPAGTYNASVVPSAIAGGIFNKDNYSITYTPAGITVNRAPLTIKADDQSRAFGALNPPLTVAYSGFVNNEGPEQLTHLPEISTNAVANSLPGRYAIIPKSATAANYTINYTPGTLIIEAVTQNLKIPNTFTPNNDGINDLWVIAGLQQNPLCTVEIYNRSGQHLYHSQGYGQAWDGTYKNQPLPSGTYYYVINLNDGISHSISGYVALLK